MAYLYRVLWVAAASPFLAVGFVVGFAVENFRIGKRIFADVDDAVWPDDLTDPDGGQ